MRRYPRATLKELEFQQFMRMVEPILAEAQADAISATKARRPDIQAGELQARECRMTKGAAASSRLQIELIAAMCIIKSDLMAQNRLFLQTFEGHELSSPLCFSFSDLNHQNWGLGRTFAALRCGLASRSGKRGARALPAPHTPKAKRLFRMRRLQTMVSLQKPRSYVQSIT